MDIYADINKKLKNKQKQDLYSNNFYFWSKRVFIWKKSARQNRLSRFAKTSALLPIPYKNLRAVIWKTS